DDGEARDLESASHHGANGTGIFHEQHGGVRRSSWCGGRGSHDFGGDRRLLEREIDRHARAALRRALEVDVAARLLHDSVNRCHAEARALADRLRGEERFEHVPAYVLAHADTGISHSNAKMRAGAAAW